MPETDQDIIDAEFEETCSNKIATGHEPGRKTETVVIEDKGSEKSGIVRRIRLQWILGGAIGLTVIGSLAYGLHEGVIQNVYKSKSLSNPDEIELKKRNRKGNFFPAKKGRIVQDDPPRLQVGFDTYDTAKVREGLLINTYTLQKDSADEPERKSGQVELRINENGISRMELEDFKYECDNVSPDKAVWHENGGVIEVTCDEEMALCEGSLTEAVIVYCDDNRWHIEGELAPGTTAYLRPVEK